jgi:hypothetical protein
MGAFRGIESNMSTPPKNPKPESTPDAPAVRAKKSPEERRLAYKENAEAALAALDRATMNVKRLAGARAASSAQRAAFLGAVAERVAALEAAVASDSGIPAE